MHIHQYALLLRVHIIIPVLLIKNSVIMRICKYALVRIHINALIRICINASQTVQGHRPDRISILVHRAQPICIIFLNMHYNGFFYGHSENWLWTLNSVAENWVWEKFSPARKYSVGLNPKITIISSHHFISWQHKHLCWPMFKAGFNCL